MTVRLLAIALVLLPARVPAVPLDPSADGPFPVGVTTVTIVDGARQRSLVTEVWYPARTAGRDAAARRARYPLVLVAHGYCGFRTNYEYLTIPLAARGFVVAAPDFPEFTKSVCDAGTQSPDIAAPLVDLSFLRIVLHDRSGPVALLAHAVRGRRTALVGHSLGGATALAAALADPSLRTVVALAPLPPPAGGAAFTTIDPQPPIVTIVGTADFLLPLDQAFFAALGAPAFLVTITGGTHSGLTDMDSHLTPEALAREQTLARRYAIAFLARYLARERRFGGFLSAADAAAQGADVMLATAGD